MLQAAAADVTAFADFPVAHWKKIWSTNPLERLNKEIKRRTDVVGVFPNPESLPRLARAVLVEAHDEWQTGDRRYLAEGTMALLVAVEKPSGGHRGAGGIVTNVDPVQRLRMAALSERAGITVGSDQLIQAALDAVLAGVDSQALNELAGLGRSEEPEAHDLLQRVIDETDLAHTLPADPRAARWELVRWWCQMIMDGRLLPETGGQMIWLDGYYALDQPQALQPLMDLVRIWEDWADEPGERRDTYRQRIIEHAKELLEQPWPPEH
jgi:hypothetical protein